MVSEKTIIIFHSRLQFLLPPVTMPSLQKHHVNVARHLKLIDKNLCANLIRHEYIVTGRTKAKRAQSKIERFLASALNKNSKLTGDSESRVQANVAFNYLQPPDKLEIGTKVVETLAKRYPNRQHGFTRIIKLEPRLGEDKAPMSVLELVDSEFEIKFWFNAKIVARLELQGLAVDDITALNVKKLVQFREGGEASFREAVETAKQEFFGYNPETGEIADESIKQNLQNLPRNLEFHGGARSGTLLASKKFKTIPRIQREPAAVPPSPFLKK